METPDNSNKELAGKIALVTGGTRGTGKAIANRLQQAGAQVVIAARNAPENNSTEQHFIAAELSKAEGTAKVVQEVLLTYGGLDILISNLGGSDTAGGSFAVLTDADWEAMLQTNLLAPVRLDRGFLPHMISRQTGVIIHIASIQARLPLFESTRP